MKVSPQNNSYVTEAWKKVTNTVEPYVPQQTVLRITEKPDSLLNDKERKQKIAQLHLDSIARAMEKEQTIATTNVNTGRGIKASVKPTLPTDSIHTPSFQHKNDTTAIEAELITFIKTNTANAVPITSGQIATSRLPGKIIALQQTITYFKAHPLKIFTGLGIGNFASKLAFRTTSMKVAGGYPKRFTYISDAFRSNHLDLYLFYFTNKDDFHSMAHSPNSTYDQVVSEYGLVGFAAFVFSYLLFFIKRIKRNTYAVPLFLFMLGTFFTDYWFEQLSVVLFFELLILLKHKENLIGR